MKHLKYLWYVLRHKWYVLVEAIKLGIPWRGLMHDASKFLPSEWFPYVSTFNGPWKYDERPDWLKRAFDIAWLKHQHRNPHHWQYWILRNDYDDEKQWPLPMPDKYRREMLADWIGAGKAQKTKGVKDWYERNKNRIILHPETREWIEKKISEL